MEKDLVLHVGPPRTGSTFLQKKLFSVLEGIVSHTKPKVHFRGEITYWGDLFHYSPEVWKRHGKEWLKDFSSDENSVLVSEERMWGRLLSPKPWRPSTSYGYEPPERPHCGYGPYSTASHINQLSTLAKQIGYDNAKVIFLVRRQDEKFASEYAKVSDRITSASQDNFEKWVQYCIRESGGYYRGGGIKMDYHLFYEAIKSKKSIDEVLVYQYEKLKSDTREFSRKILKDLSLGRKCNISHTNNISKDKINGRKKNGQKWEVRNGPKFDYIGISKRLSDKIISIYDKSNMKIDKEFESLDLADAGYY